MTYNCRFCGTEVIRIAWVDDKEPEDFEQPVCKLCQVSQ